MRPDNLRPVRFKAPESSYFLRGYFHRWGEVLDYITDKKTSLYGAAEVVGIIEAENGQVYEVHARNIRFLDLGAEEEPDDQYPVGGAW